MARLSDEELAAIEARVQEEADVARLLGELRELRRREAALLEIARGIAAIPNLPGKGGRSRCIACGRFADDHRPDCVREQARALLGITPPTSA
jgi:hypothetical protein